ncbi:Rne/Rng family ribonuclease [Amaricoccus solimangrovi]|uniref:Ribonuclease E n=1 Tax=Amaricoccus solimangrovi TaxID=2589815 RepID=A0A501WKC4_9RHOB|nr:Rne/Rng family ribonuclease [Amaricoccus solimangrovi]TPE49222.1 Rne/Rng family ribonuclease [Amaricoccus solimangrovi]
MTRKMLIDATHAEETRVVVVDGNKVDEFDFESLNKRQLAGNIYLAKVTRVEPSLQAAFVDYGGNRHGFLAFSEIHPDYYQIPKADREALLAEEAALAREAEEEAPREKPKPKPRSRSRRRAQPAAEGLGAEDAVVVSDVVPAETGAEPSGDAGREQPGHAHSGHAASDHAPRTDWVDAAPEGVGTEDRAEESRGGDEPAFADAPPPNAASGEVEIRVADEPEGTPDLVPVEAPRDEASDARDDEHADAGDRGEDAPKARGRGHEDDDAQDEYESVGGDDVAEERAPRKQVRHRRYKIQEVIKVRQILLVQVVKEERGNKGAALTTYLSLAGRYCVLMPNTARGGGISRKITNAADRKKLKEISNSITVPEGAGLIIRTAGANRTKTEIKRDYEYLLRQWEQIRDLTLKSIAPAPIYEEGSLIKRVIRDLYSRDIDEVLVDGERGYREAKDYMKMLMPSHAKNVKHYNEALPLFSRFQVENYLSAMFNPVVQLKSGGYIVIDVTEALVAIDVNSGRATREASIEETALKTNLEAAEEAARQMRLRDLAGLIVIDFIDMEDRRNNAAVEKRLKEKLKSDRARIQVGRISGFGLLEMSRQRLRPGMIEATTKPCAHCHGTGRVRSDDSLALALLREVEEEGTRQRSKEVLIVAPVEIANYLLNQKREHVALIESRFGLSVRVEGDPALISPDFKLERFKTASRVIPAPAAMALPAVAYPEDDFADEAEETEAEDEGARSEAAEGNGDQAGDQSGDRQGKRKRRRRRRGRGAEDQARETEPARHVESIETHASLPADVMEPVEDGVEGMVAEAGDETSGEASGQPAEAAKPEPRTRSRRRSRGGAGVAAQPNDGLGEVIDLGEGTAPEIVDVPEASAPAPRKRERIRRPAPTTEGEAEASAPDETTPTEPALAESTPAETGAAEPLEASTMGATLFEPMEPAAQADGETGGEAVDEPAAAELAGDADATGQPPAALPPSDPRPAEAPEAEAAPVAEAPAPEPAAEDGFRPADQGGIAAPDFVPAGEIPDVAAFQSPSEAPEILDAPFEAPYETLTAETPPEDPLPAETPAAAEAAPEAAPEATAEAPAEVQGEAQGETPAEPEAPREYETAVAAGAEPETDGPAAPKRRGWWSRD